jgi:hypothetical protein
LEGEAKAKAKGTEDGGSNADGFRQQGLKGEME